MDKVYLKGDNQIKILHAYLTESSVKQTILLTVDLHEVFICT